MSPALSAPPQRRLFHSVGTRLALATALLVLAVAGVSYMALVRYEQEGLHSAKQDAATMVAALFAELSSAPVLFGDDQSIRESIGYLDSNEEVLEAAVFGLGADGTLRSGKTLGRLQRKRGQPTGLAPPLERDVGALVRDRDHLDATAWVNDPSGHHIAAVAVRFSLARENRRFELLARRTRQLSIGLALGLLVLLLLLARIYIISPLRAVHTAVRELSSGSQLDRTRTLPLTARDEVGDLARGFVKMADAIARRERDIADQNHEMRLVLDSVGEGFLVLDARGVIIGQHSAVLETWFGPVPTGQPLFGYLRPHDPEQAEWLELAWENIGREGMPLALCLEQLPKQLTAAGREFLFDYRPRLDDQGALEKMVVVIADVTELRRREQAESEQRELVAVFSALVRDRTGFVSFYEDANLLIKNLGDPERYDGRLLLEQLHTLKGNALLFRLRVFGEACEQLESACAEQARLPSSQDAPRLAEALAVSIGPVEPFIALDRGHSVQISARDYASLVHSLQSGVANDVVLSGLMRASAEPVELVFGRFAERLQVLARRLGKCPVRVVCEAHGLRFPKQSFAPLWAAAVHVLRNIADHGLETGWQREQTGKNPQATVSIGAEVLGDHLLIRFCDDGRGIDWDKVRARAEYRGLPAATEDDLVRALLGHGFSTLNDNSALSGRGVGLAALHSEVTQLGGTVQITSETGRGTELTIALPAQLLAA
ncbi:MAG: ATP-binding protein [Polyangiales bacterium]